MTNNKLTNKKALEIAIAAINEMGEVTSDFTIEEVVDKLNKMIVQLDKKKGSDKKPTVRQLENEKLKPLILDYLKTCGESKTVTEITKAIPELSDLSNQRVSFLVKDLKEAKLLEKEIIKGRSYFYFKKQD